MRGKLISLFLLLALCVMAQTPATSPKVTLTGRIVNDANEPLAGAHVWLVQLSDTLKKHGTATDADGKFTRSVPREKYELRVSYIGCVGHTSQIQAQQDIDLPVIALLNASNTLSEVEITAKRVVYNVKGYKANIQQTPIFKQHTMDNILRFLPGISVKPEGITAYGQGIAAVYVNGRKVRLRGSDLVGYLSTFEGKNIVSVEVLDSTTEPGGMPGGGSVLKITTIHDTDGGSCTIGLSGGAGPIEVPHAGGSVNLIAKSGRWNMYAVSKVDPYSKRTPESRSGTDYLNTGESRLESSSSYFKMKPLLSQVVGVSYDFDKKSSLAFDGNVRYSKSEQGSVTRSELLKNGMAAGSSNGLANTDRKAQSYNFTLEYRYSAPKFFFQTYATYGKRRNSGDNFREHHLKEASLRKDTENRLHTQDDAQVWTLTTGGKWKINKQNNLSVYAEYYGWDNTSDTDSRSETDGQTDPYQTYTEKYLYKETTATAKASYNFSTDKFSLGLGARFRYTHLKPRVEPANESFSREYADVLPYASVMYLIDPMKGHRLELNYSRMAGYPGMSELNPGKRWTSEYEYSTGNPELEPRYEDLLMLQATFWGYTLGASYRSESTFLFEPTMEEGTNIVVKRPMPGSKNRLLNFSLSAPFTPCNGWMLSVGAGYGYQMQEYKGNKVNDGGWTFDISSMNDLPLGLNLMIWAMYASTSKDTYTDASDMYMVNASLSRSFLKGKLNTSLGFSYSNDIKIKTTTDSFRSWSEPTKHKWDLSLSLRYTLNWGKRVMKKNISNSGEVGRMDK